MMVNVMQHVCVRQLSSNAFPRVFKWPKGADCRYNNSLATAPRGVVWTREHKIVERKVARGRCRDAYGLLIYHPTGSGSSTLRTTLACLGACILYVYLRHHSTPKTYGRRRSVRLGRLSPIALESIISPLTLPVEPVLLHHGFLLQH